jgi:hypothetical protein
VTQEEAFKLYVAAGGNPDHSFSEKEDILKEVEAVIAAKSDRAAGRVIQWWECWNPYYSATAFARRIRVRAGSERKKGAA